MVFQRTQIVTEVGRVGLCMPTIVQGDALDSCSEWTARGRLSRPLVVCSDFSVVRLSAAISRTGLFTPA